MSPSIIVTLILLGIWGIFKILEKKQRSEPDRILERLNDTQSFPYSLMIILVKPTTEIKTSLEKLFETSGYLIEESKNKKNSFHNWNDEIYFDTKHLNKGIIELTDSVVLNDPESIIITDREKIKQLSKDLNCKILVSIWERVSRTVMFDVYDNGALVSTTSVTDGKADKDNINPDVDLIKRADSEQLKIALTGNGLNTEELFNNYDLPITEYHLRDNP